MTIFFECAGESAHAVLKGLAESCARLEGWRRGRLLRSAEQPDLYLLVSEWQGEVASPTAPKGVKVWRFRTVGGTSLIRPEVAQKDMNP